MLTRFCMPLFALCLLAGCKGYELNQQKFTDDTIQWGEPVNGLRVGIARREFVAGAAPGGRGVEYYSVHLMNVGRRDLTILSPVAQKGVMPEDLAGDESVAVKLLYDTPSGTKTGEFKPIKKPVLQSMEPGKAYTLELRLAPERFGLTKFVPGRMSAVYSNHQDSIRYQTMGGEPIKGLWTGDARSGTIVVEPVVATQPATTRAAAGGAEK